MGGWSFGGDTPIALELLHPDADFSHAPISAELCIAVIHQDAHQRTLDGAESWMEPSIPILIRFLAPLRIRSDKAREGQENAFDIRK